MMASYVTTLFLLNVFSRKLRSTAHSLSAGEQEALPSWGGVRK